MILTLEASEIAPYSGYGKRARSGKEVKERFFFNRVDIERDRTTVDEGIKLAFPVLAHSTDSPF